jgi:hypothetical protein
LMFYRRCQATLIKCHLINDINLIVKGIYLSINIMLIDIYLSWDNINIEGSR